MSKEMDYIDVHGHVSFAAYDADREAVIKRAQALKVGMITVGTDLESSRNAIALAEANENMWATIGMHPVYVSESHNDPQETGKDPKAKRPAETFDIEAFKALAKHPKVVAIGECGLDFFHTQPEFIELQRELFIQHIELANEVHKPLMLHVRNGKDGKNAYQEAIEILKEHAKVRADFHFFAGNIDDVKKGLEIGCMFSFTGVITFARNYDDAINLIPINHIMSETDCPYVSPAPHRGKRNEPSYVIEVAKTIAKVRGEDEGNIRRQLVQNARDFFML